MIDERHQLRPSLQLLLLVLACLLVKAGLVLSLADVFFYGEELEKGTAAKAMLDGLDVPHHQLAYHYYEGGGFVISHLKALAFLLVGENLLAHKLVAFFFVGSVLALGWVFTRTHFGPRAALWFVLLFTFAPESYQKLSLINLGIHFEACVFLFAILWLGGRLAFGECGGRRHWLRLGLVTGFGLYFSYQVALVAAWVALVLLVRRPRKVLGLEGLLGILGTALGALPLIWMYSLVGSAVFDIHGESLAAAAEGRGTKLLAFARSLFVDAPPLGLAMVYGWSAATAVCLPALLRRRGGPLREARSAVFVLGYLLLFCGVYASSSFVQGTLTHFFLLLRLAPVWCLMTVLVAAGLCSLESGRLRLLVGGGLLTLGLASTAHAMLEGDPGRMRSNLETLRETKGYSYEQYFAKVFWHFELQEVQALLLVEEFEEDAPAWVRAAAVQEVFSSGGAPAETSLPRALEALAELPPERFDDYAFGLGFQLLVASRWDVGAALELLESYPSDLTPVLMESLGRTGGGRHPLRESFDLELERAAHLEDPSAYLRGLGRWAYARFQLSEAKAEAFWRAADETTRSSLLEGYRRERAWHTLGD